MRERIIQGLAPVRRRQFGQQVARGAVLGLLVSSLAGIGLGLRHWVALVPVSPAEAWAILLAGPVLGGLIALARRLPWHAAAVAADPVASGRSAAARAAENSDGWWLHIDVDVLAEDELGSQFVPGDQGTPGGLTWQQLTSALTAALGVDGCRGLSVSIYDPDQDPDGSDARRIVQLIGKLAPYLTPRSPE